MDVDVWLDKTEGDFRQQAHREIEVRELKSRVKELEFDCAELQKSNDELRERVKKLALKKPRGFAPRRNNNFNRNRKSN